MRTRFLFSFVLLLSLHLTATAAYSTSVLPQEDHTSEIDQTATEFPIFGKKKTSNKKQRKFATKRSRRNGKGVMRARKNRGKNNGKSVKGGSRSKRGSKKKAGCNT